MEIFRYAKWAIKNYGVVMKNKAARKNLEQFTITDDDFNRLINLSRKKIEIDNQLSKAWKEIGDRMGFDYRTVVPKNPTPSPEILAIRIPSPLAAV